MTDHEYDQSKMLSTLPRHKEQKREHEFLPRYAYVGKLLTNFRYDQHELKLLQQWIDNIEPYKESDNAR